MSENKPPAARRRLPRVLRQRGVSSVEFALLAIIFFSMVFGIIETARAVYLLNTLQEVTRRAAAEAANSPFDQATIDQIRERALLGTVDGKLILGDPVTPDHLKIDYLALARDPDSQALTMVPASPMPSDPTSNYLNCLSNPYASNCIRLVRVRICDPDAAGECGSVPYQMLLPLIDFTALRLPHATTVVPAQTLGR